MSDTSFPDNLPTLPGFDLHDALTRLRGKWDRLQKLIVMFAEHNEGALLTFQTLLNEEKWEEAQRLMHQLKGSGANLGAINLSAVAEKIEQQIKHQHYKIPASLMKELEAALHELALAKKIIADLPQ